MRVEVRLANPANRDEVLVEQALIDTGATWTTLPRSLANEMRLDIIGQTTVRTVEGLQTLDQSYAWVEIEGKELVTFTLISDTYPGLLIGVTTQEGMGFAVEPTSQRLIDSELLLL